MVVSWRPRRIAWSIAALALLVPLGAFAGVMSLLAEAAEAPPPPAPPASARLPERIASEPDGAWRFAILGDPEDNAPVFRACLQKARQEGCEFVVLTGDLVKHWVTPAFQVLRKDLGEFGFADRVAAVRGNHDPEWLYRAFFGASDWTFEFGGVRFVGLDNANDRITGERLAFAREAFRAPRHGDCVLFTHRPVFPYVKSDGGAAAETPLERYHAGNGGNEAALQPVCVENHVDYVLTAHLHAYERGVFDGVTQVVSGGAGGRPQGGFDGWHFLIGDVVDGRVTVRRVDVAEPAFAVRLALRRAGLSVARDLVESPVSLSVGLLGAAAGALVLLLWAVRMP